MSSSNTAAPQSNRTGLIVGLVAVVVVLLAVVAILISGSGDSDEAEPTVTTAPGATTALPGENPAPPSGQPPQFQGEARDVEIEGAALPPYDPSAGPDQAIGLRPPLLVAEDANGTVHTISPDIAGPTMIVFLAHWCPVCNTEVPSILRVSASGGFPDDINVYGVLTGIAPDRPNFPPSRWLDDLGWPFVAVADGLDLEVSPAVWAASDAFGLQSYPYTVLINDGVVVDRWAGELGDAGLAARVAAALS